MPLLTVPPVDRKWSRQFGPPQNWEKAEVSEEREGEQVEVDEMETGYGSVVVTREWRGGEAVQGDGGHWTPTMQPMPRVLASHS